MLTAFSLAGKRGNPDIGKFRRQVARECDKEFHVVITPGLEASSKWLQP
jgi:hypothetical protein